MPRGRSNHFASEMRFPKGNRYGGDWGERMWRLPLALILVPLFAQQRPLDVVLLVERAPGLQWRVSPAAFAMGPEDRVAVVSFDKTTHLELPFTNDPQRISTALNRLDSQAAVHVRARKSSIKLGHRLSRAVLDSIRLFAMPPTPGGRQLAIVAVFATEDDSNVPTSDDLKKALLAAQLRFFGAAVHLVSDCCPLSPTQTPPTVPGHYTLIEAPLPEATMKLAAGLATATGGVMLKESKIPAILAQIRSDGQSPGIPQAR